MFPWTGITHVWTMTRHTRDTDDSLAERSKAPDSSSGGAIRVGSNPTAVNFFFSFVTANLMSFLSVCICVKKPMRLFGLVV